MADQGQSGGTAVARARAATGLTDAAAVDAVRAYCEQFMPAAVYAEMYLGVPADPLEDLRYVAEDLADADRQRAVALSRRDQLVEELRARGYTWPQLAEAAGVTRVALMRRAGEGS